MSLSWLSQTLDIEDEILLHEFPEMNMNFLENYMADDIDTVIGANQQLHSLTSSVESTTSNTATKSTMYPNILNNNNNVPHTDMQPIGRKNSHKNYSSQREKNLPVILNFGSSSISNNSNNNSNGNIIKDIDNQEYVSPLRITTTQKDSEARGNQFAQEIYCDTHPHLQDGVLDRQLAPTKRKQPATSTKDPSHARDHILAERKRREKISQRFIALSALVPDLKRMDKTSVLGEAIRYIKELQERIKVLEEENNARKAVETATLVEKSQVLLEENDDNNASSCSGDDQELPISNKDHVTNKRPNVEIEVKVSNKNILLKIQCAKRQGTLKKIIEAVEKHGLSITTVHTTPFGDTTLDITIISQKEHGIEVRPQKIVSEVSSVFKAL